MPILYGKNFIQFYISEPVHRESVEKSGNEIGSSTFYLIFKKNLFKSVFGISIHPI